MFGNAMEFFNSGHIFVILVAIGKERAIAWSYSYIQVQPLCVIQPSKGRYKQRKKELYFISPIYYLNRVQSNSETYLNRVQSDPLLLLLRHPSMICNGLISILYMISNGLRYISILKGILTDFSLIKRERFATRSSQF